MILRATLSMLMDISLRQAFCLVVCFVLLLQHDSDTQDRDPVISSFSFALNQMLFFPSDLSHQFHQLDNLFLHTKRQLVGCFLCLYTLTDLCVKQVLVKY